MTYRTMQGKVIDMEKLMRQHELTPAVGNQRVNARGDELGTGGRIIRRREDIMNDYYEGHPDSRPTVKSAEIQPTPNSKKNKDV